MLWMLRGLYILVKLLQSVLMSALFRGLLKVKISTVKQDIDYDGSEINFFSLGSSTNSFSTETVLGGV